MFKKFKFLLFVIFITFCFNLSYALEIWYEDNNMGEPNRYPSDFVDKFYNTGTWENSLRCIDVYMIRSNVLMQFDENFFKNVLKPFLNNNKIKLALDVTGATWTQANKKRLEVKEKELELLKLLKKNGIVPCCIILQSVLDKPLKDQTGNIIEYSFEKRIEDIINYIKDVKKIFPEISFGLIDATPSHGKDYVMLYSLLNENLKQENLKLNYIILDTTFGLLKTRKNNMSWYKVKEIESFVKTKLGLKFGIIATSRSGGLKSNTNFYEDVTAFADCYYSAGGSPDIYIITSWFNHPDITVPEKCDNNYPAMCTLLEFCKKTKFFKYNIKNLKLRCNL